MEKITVAVICGTTRPKRQSIKAARYVAEIGAQRSDTKIIFVDPRQLNLPDDGNDSENRDPKYSEITATADAFFIVTPEYNHSFPGSLKRLLDSEYDNYFHKPVALAGVSNGPWGGARGIQTLLPSLRTLRMVSIWTTVYFPKVQEIFDENGQIMPGQDEIYRRQVEGAYSELLWMARVLKTAAKQEIGDD
jgi:NAD(P)H-dependent FMN reductase